MYLKLSVCSNAITREFCDHPPLNDPYIPNNISNTPASPSGHKHQRTERVWAAMQTAASGAVRTNFVVWSVAEAGVGARREAQGVRGSGRGVGGADDDGGGGDEGRRSPSASAVVVGGDSPWRRRLCG
jgi:hypothetical protein